MINLPIISNSRMCGDCIICCTTLGVIEINKDPGVKCSHVSSQGCTIYSDRPRECREYKCFWLMGMSPDNNRPDKIGYTLGLHKELSIGKGILTAVEAFPNGFDNEKTMYSLKKLSNDIGQPIIMMSYWRERHTIVLPKSKQIQAKVKATFKDRYDYVAG